MFIAPVALPIPPPATAPPSPPSAAAVNGFLSFAFLVGSNLSPAAEPIAPAAAFCAKAPLIPAFPSNDAPFAVPAPMTPAAPPNAAQSISLIVSFSDL